MPTATAKITSKTTTTTNPFAHSLTPSTSSTTPAEATSTTLYLSLIDDSSLSLTRTLSARHVFKFFNSFHLIRVLHSSLPIYASTAQVNTIHKPWASIYDSSLRTYISASLSTCEIRMVGSNSFRLICSSQHAMSIGHERDRVSLSPLHF